MKFNKKNKILLASFILMLFVSYKLSIQKTIQASKEYQTNFDKKELLKNIPNQLSLLSAKEQHLDKQLSLLNVDNSSMQNSLLKFLNREAGENKVKIIEFNSPHVVHKDENISETQIFTLEGGYSNILNVIHAIENKGNFGAISHMEMEKKKDYRSKRTYLQASVFLEQLK
jgi:hypothetical protein